MIDRGSENGSAAGGDGGVLMNAEEDDGSFGNSGENGEKTSEKDFQGVIQVCFKFNSIFKANTIILS